jgi:hypothetical protein
MGQFPAGHGLRGAALADFIRRAAPESGHLPQPHFLALEGRVGLYLAFRYDTFSWSGRLLARLSYGLLILKMRRPARRGANVP